MQITAIWLNSLSVERHGVVRDQYVKEQARRMNRATVTIVHISGPVMGD